MKCYDQNKPALFDELLLSEASADYLTSYLKFGLTKFWNSALFWYPPSLMGDTFFSMIFSKLFGLLTGVYWFKVGSFISFVGATFKEYFEDSIWFINYFFLCEICEYELFWFWAYFFYNDSLTDLLNSFSDLFIERGRYSLIYWMAFWNFGQVIGNALIDLPWPFNLMVDFVSAVILWSFETF